MYYRKRRRYIIDKYDFISSEEAESALKEALKQRDLCLAYQVYIGKYDHSYKTQVAPIDEEIIAIENDKKNYIGGILGMKFMPKLNDIAEDEISKLKAEKLKTEKLINARLRPVIKPIECSIELHGSHISCLQKELARQLDTERKDTARAIRDNKKKAQIAHALGRSRNLAVTIKNKLPTDHNCPYCDSSLGDGYHADHIYPVSKGGQSREENMVNVCSKCNQKKSDHTLTTFIHTNNLNRSAIESRLKQLGKEF